MNPRVEVKGLGAVAGTVAGLPEAWDGERVAALKRSGQLMVRSWKIHLSGPAGPRKLGVQTGRLRRSIGVDRKRSTNDAVIVGSDAPYAAVHEFGFRGTVNVQAHRRRPSVRAGAGRLRRLASRVRRAFSRGHEVRAHTRRVSVPERPHRKPAVDDHAPIHQNIVLGAIDGAIRESKRIAKMRKSQGRGALAAIVSAGGTGRR